MLQFWGRISARGCQMKRSSCFLRVLTVALFLLLAGGVAKADPIDPKILLGGGGSCTNQNQVSLTQSFTVDANCINDFKNLVTAGGHGVTLDSLVVTVSGGPFVITCGLNPGAALTAPPIQTPTGCIFSIPKSEGCDESDCQTAGFESTHLSCEESDDCQTTGIGPGQVYGLSLDDNNPLPHTYSITVSSIPEPASIVLIGTGLAALVARRKKQGSKPLAS
jgi:PEP-CTERM motif